MELAELVPVTKFLGLKAEHQAGQKTHVIAALAGHSQWHKTIAQILPKHGIKLSCTLTEDGSLIAAHVCLHSDSKLIKLGKDYGFPRGFCIIVDARNNRLVGQGTFYPKFTNDDRNAGFSAKDFGGIEKISCFLKYSGSTGIITIIFDDAGVAVGWTGSSKNNCNHEPRGNVPSFAAEISRVFSCYVSKALLRWCTQRKITSFGLEVCLQDDQVHGYGYHGDGCIVTAMTKQSSAGQPIYVAPAELYELCCEVGLPTDRPIVVEGVGAVHDFVSSLAACRDVLTLSLLRRVLANQGVALQTLHEQLIDSFILEGFVIRRWKAGVEVESVKFKVWLYQLVTQVLRPFLADGGRVLDGTQRDKPIKSLKTVGGEPHPQLMDNARAEMKRWCTDTSPEMRYLCLWLIHAAARSSLPPGLSATAVAPSGCVPRNSRRAYWVLLGEHAAWELSKLLEEAGWDPCRAAALAKSREPGPYDGSAVHTAAFGLLDAPVAKLEERVNTKQIVQDDVCPVCSGTRFLVNDDCPLCSDP